MFDLKKEAIGFESELIALRRDFHENPELGYKEFRTSKMIYDYLKKLGIEVKNISKTGVVGHIYGEAGPGKTILLRANMDALPVQEDTGLPFASTNEGVMHASGHDGHMAILLVLAKILNRHRDEFGGCVKLMFQPNEEEAGALDMINEGILENPVVDGACSLHLWSALPSGHVGLSQGPVLGTTEEFEVTVYGKSSNTATPHTGKDAVLGAAKIIDALQVLSTREYDPLWPMSIMVGKITGGTARNIIADRVKLGGTIRFLFPEEKMHQKKVKEAFRRVVAGVCSTLDLQYELQFIPSNPSLINDGRMVALMKKAVEYTYGTTECMEETKSLIGEDFAEISQRVPAVMVFLGIYQPEAGSIYPQYHPKFTIDESVMRYGLELLLRATLRFLNEK